jgi:RNA polymerase sigma factor (sigma-70 family)
MKVVYRRGGRYNFIITSQVERESRRLPPGLPHPYLSNVEYHALTDKEILDKSPDNPRLFEVLVVRYQSAFMRKTISVLHSSDMAEDIVQETFLKIYKYAGSFKEQDGASVKSWMYKILLNTCYTHYARRKKEHSQIEYVDFAEVEFADTAEPQTDNEKRPYIESILSKMPHGLADMLRLYFLEEKSQKQIAKDRNMSLEAVRTRIHRAKKYFRNISAKTL